MSMQSGPRAAGLLLAASLTLTLLGAPTASAATGPTATDDSATLPAGSGVVLAGATNDVAGSAAIQAAKTTFPGDGQPSGAVVSNAGRTIEVPKHGTFSVDPDGSVSFKAWTGLTGDVSVRYRIVDANGATDDASLSVTVTAGGTRDDVAVSMANRVSGIDVLANDIPGRNADGTPGTLDPSSVRFSDDQVDPGVTVSDAGKTIRESRVGVAAIDDQGRLTFYAYSFDTSGNARQGMVYYTAQDTTRAADGTVSHHSYRAAILLIGYPNTVLPKYDRLSTPMGTPVTLPGLLNDRDSNPTFVLRPELSRFWAGSVDPGDVLSADGRTLVHTGQGTWSINGDGSVSYVPVAGYSGIDAVEMFVFDDHGNRGEEELVVTVTGPVPVALDNWASTVAGTAVEIPVLGNDKPGAASAPLVPSSIRLRLAPGLPDGSRLSGDTKTLVVAGAGTFVARTDGVVVFTPVAGFVGTVPTIGYQVSDSRGTGARASITVQVRKASA